MTRDQAFEAWAIEAPLPLDDEWGMLRAGWNAGVAYGQREALEEYPTIRGRCPACGRESLFVGADGYITCSHLDCPDPTEATDRLLVPNPRLIAANQEYDALSRTVLEIAFEMSHLQQYHDMRSDGDSGYLYEAFAKKLTAAAKGAK